MQHDLTVPILACSACVEMVTKAVQGVDAAAQVTVDPKTKQVSILSEVSEIAIKEPLRLLATPWPKGGNHGNPNV